MSVNNIRTNMTCANDIGSVCVAVELRSLVVPPLRDFLFIFSIFLFFLLLPFFNSCQCGKCTISAPRASTHQTTSSSHPPLSAQASIHNHSTA
jgi:hypothetical protein